MNDEFVREIVDYLHWLLKLERTMDVLYKRLDEAEAAGVSDEMLLPVRATLDALECEMGESQDKLMMAMDW